MVDEKLTNFNIGASIRRMDEILNRNDRTFTERDRIPSVGSLTFSNGSYVPCVALCTDIRDSSTLPSIHKRPVLAKIYRTYLSEIPALMSINKLCKHVHIVGDAVVGIFNVPNPARQMDELFILGGDILSLVGIMNDKFQQKGYTPIRIGIGMDYGRALMIKAGFLRSGINDVVWMGDVVNRASKLSNSANKEPDDQIFMVTEDVYNNLSEGGRGYLQWSSKHECYEGSFYNTKFQEFYENMKKWPKRPTSSPEQLQPTLSSSTTTVSSLTSLLNPSPSPNRLFDLGGASLLSALGGTPSKEDSDLGPLARALMGVSKNPK